MRFVRSGLILALLFVGIAGAKEPIAPIGAGAGFEFACGPVFKPPVIFEKYGPRYTF